MKIHFLNEDLVNERCSLVHNMIVRMTEQKKLEEIYHESGNRLYILYGRSGCGMHALLRQFCENKKSFYYRARNASPQEQLRQLQKEIEKQFQVSLTKDTYEECFNRIKSGDPSKLVVVIDAFDLIAKKDAAFFESILKLKAKRLYPGPVLILLCNSSIAWTEKDMAACLGEGVSKIDGMMKLDDMNFLDVVRAFPEYSVAQCVETYGIIGGVPAYLNRWNGKKSIRENICNNILDPNGFLFSEAEDYIRGELRELSVYDTILASIASGNEKLNDLFASTGYSRAKISVYMKNLAAFDVIEKVISFETGGWDNAKKGVYHIRNHYVNFWFTFIYPNLSDLYRMTPEDFYNAHIKDDLDDYLRQYFVSVCTEYLQLLNQVGQVPIKLTKMGTWVGKKGTIDVIGQNEQRENVVGVCNWKETELSYRQYEDLLMQMKKARISAKVIYLFSAKKFDKKLMELVQDNEQIILVDMTEL